MKNYAPEKVIGYCKKWLLKGILAQGKNPNQDEIHHEQEKPVLTQPVTRLTAKVVGSEPGTHQMQMHPGKKYEPQKTHSTKDRHNRVVGFPHYCIVRTMKID